jgi:hypothetical protein
VEAWLELRLVSDYGICREVLPVALAGPLFCFRLAWIQRFFILRKYLRRLLTVICLPRTLFPPVTFYGQEYKPPEGIRPIDKTYTGVI